MGEPAQLRVGPGEEGVARLLFVGLASLRLLQEEGEIQGLHGPMIVAARNRRRFPSEHHMALSKAELHALSRLLDEGLALPVEQRDAWLAALPDGDRPLAGRLRRLLAEQASPSPARRLDEPPPLGPLPWAGQAGEAFGPYRLVTPLGRGGMGEVWRAHRADGRFERAVALKLPRRRLGLDEQLAGRLRQECQVLARLEHPHIARLYDAGVDAQGRPWIASELVEGPDLHQWQRSRPWWQRLALLVQVAGAVDHAHQRGVVHGDLKPANVLVAADGAPRLVDFGIGAVMGQPEAAASLALTPRYAAPELQAGGAQSVQTDVHALGVMAQELLSDGMSDLAGPLQADLAAVIAKACQPEPAQRYASARQLGDDLQACLSGRPVQARPLGAWRRGLRLLRCHRWATAALGASAMAVAAAGVGLWHAREAQRISDREQLVRRFATELFTQPVALSGGEASPLLERGAALISTRFAGDAALRAELHAAVGQAYSDMGAFRLALEHRNLQLEALRSDTARRTRAADQLAAEVDLAEVHAQLGDPQAALSQLPAARALPEGSGLWRRAELLAARSAADLGRFDDVLRSIERLEHHLPLGDTSTDAAWLRALRAELTLRDGRLDEGFAGLDDAAAMARRAQGPESLEAAWILLRGVQQAGMAERRQLTERWVAQATQALRARGSTFRVRAVVEKARMWRALAATLRSVSMGEAVAGIQACLEELRSLGPAVPPLLIAEVEGRLGDVRFDFGDLGGADSIEQHYPLRLAAARRPMEAVALHGVAAAAAAETGRYDVALERSRARHLARMAAGRGDHPNVAVDLRQQALIHAMAGQTDAALAVLDGAPPAAAMRTVTGLEPPWYANVLAEARARVLLDAGRPAQALAVLPRRAALPQDFVLVGLMTAPDAVRGEALCALGRPAEGWPLLRDHIARLNPNRDPHAASVARLQAVAALCARAAGASRAGLVLAAEARASFAARPQVAAYFKAPLGRGE